MSKLGRDEGVSEVVGSIMVLAISMLAITATMFWGVPFIQDLRAQAVADSVTRDFVQFREDGYTLRIRDAAVTSPIFVGQGTIGIQPGQNIMLSWAVATDGCYLGPLVPTRIATTVQLQPVNCPAIASHPVAPTTWGVLGHSLGTESVPLAVSGNQITLPSALGSDAWQFQFVDSTGAVKAEAWYIPSTKLEWSDQSEDLGVILDGGFVMHRAGESYGMPSSAPFVLEDGSLRLRTVRYSSPDELINSNQADSEILQRLRSLSERASGAATNVELSFSGIYGNLQCTFTSIELVGDGSLCTSLNRVRISSALVQQIEWVDADVVATFR